MMAPPGYPKTVCTPSAINASNTACEPEIETGSLIAVSLSFIISSVSI